MTDIITPQAGWYPDPTDSRAYRWWSGGSWTDHLTAAPSAETVWATGGTAGQPLVVGADAFQFTEQGPSPFSSSFERSWVDSEPRRASSSNRSGIVVVVIGVIAVAVPMLLGLPSAADVNQVNQVVSHTVSFHSTVEKQLVANAQKNFGQAATSAACPSDVLPAASSTFSCTETLADGTTAVVNVTVADSSGTVTWVRAAG
jgi:hypothetical protein